MSGMFHVHPIDQYPKSPGRSKSILRMTELQVIRRSPQYVSITTSWAPQPSNTPATNLGAMLSIIVFVFIQLRSICSDVRTFRLTWVFVARSNSCQQTTAKRSLNSAMRSIIAVSETPSRRRASLTTANLLILPCESLASRAADSIAASDSLSGIINSAAIRSTVRSMDE